MPNPSFARLIPALLLALTLAAPAPAPAAPTTMRTRNASTRPRPKVDVEEVLNPKDQTPAWADAAKAIEQYPVPPGLKLDIWAAEPMVSNPVCLWPDDKGRVWVVETFRFDGGGPGEGVYDIRHMYDRLDDDLACKTVEDRLAAIKKWEKNDLTRLDTWPDRIRLLEDRDHDGRADHSTVFNDDFRDPLDGVASGILVRGNDIYFANIPHLWLLNVNDPEQRKSLSYGYGVRYNFLGHDLHGLRFGPDGKLYFSIGDRGLHVETKEGKILDNPDSGSVLRCDPDGSNLELFATGLRNPQELAFDDYGNLFTGDNNCDFGDPARFLYVVEGGDTGWRVGFQHIKTPKPTGPWLAEKLPELEPANTGLYLIPPVAHIASGPSGLTYYPGTGLPEKYKGHFFLCDFRAGPSSKIHSFALTPKGASFEPADLNTFVDHMTATDCEFGPDSSLYITDWNASWKKTARSRIYRVTWPDAKPDDIKQTRDLLAAGMSGRTPEQLQSLLSHTDSRVRLAAQFQLASSTSPETVALLSDTAAKAPTQLARIHAIWALGQIARKSPQAISPVAPLLADPDPEIRAQSAKILGDSRYAPAGDKLITLLTDASPRVRFFAAMSLGKLARKDAAPALFKLIADNADKDAFLRHAAVMALTGAADPSTLVAASTHENPSVRIAATLALRRLKRPEIATFLNDSNPKVVLEAARAISDVPIPDAFPALASLLGKSKLEEPVLLRALNANFRLGQQENAERLATAAADTKDTPESMRVEALSMLADFTTPHGADRVLGVWRPVTNPNRDPALARSAITPILKNILASAPDPVRLSAIDAIKTLDLKDPPLLYDVVTNKDMSPDVAAAALDVMDAFKDPRTDETVELSLKNGKGALRTAAIKLLSRKPDAVARLSVMLASNKIADQQPALEALGSVEGPDCDQLLTQWLDKLLDNQVPPELQLDLLEAADKSKSSTVKEKLKSFNDKRPKGDPLADYREALAGGDAALGRKIFLERAEVSCLRCHKVSGEGGSVGGVAGPDLSSVGAKQDRTYLLESIINPNAKIAPGFESVTVRVKAGKNYVGVVKADDDKTIVLDAGDGATIHIDKKEIEKRTKGLSPMPQDISKPLSKRDIRNLIEFLASQKQPTTQPVAAQAR